MPELPAKNEVYDEVDRGIENQSKVIEAGETEKPGRRCEHGAASDQVVGHHNLIAVEDDAGDVTAEEHEHNTDDDQSEVDFSLDRLPAATMRESKEFCQRKLQSVLQIT